MATVHAASGAEGVKQLEALVDLPLTNFAWSRDVYAKVLWVRVLWVSVKVLWVSVSSAFASCEGGVLRRLSTSGCAEHSPA